jgi:hypothetical protein
MKRDMNLIRELLLKIEEAKEPPYFAELVSQDPDEYQLAAYQMQMLIEEVGLVRGIDGSSMERRDWYELQLTWRGQDFVDDIRNSTVWEKTKEGAKKVGGVSFDLLIGLAKEYAKAEIKARLGFDL